MACPLYQLPAYEGDSRGPARRRPGGAGLPGRPGRHRVGDVGAEPAHLVAARADLSPLRTDHGRGHAGMALRLHLESASLPAHARRPHRRRSRQHRDGSRFGGRRSRQGLAAAPRGFLRRERAVRGHRQDHEHDSPDAPPPGGPGARGDHAHRGRGCDLGHARTARSRIAPGGRLLRHPGRGARAEGGPPARVEWPHRERLGRRGSGRPPAPLLSGELASIHPLGGVSLRRLVARRAGGPGHAVCPGHSRLDGYGHGHRGGRLRSALRLVPRAREPRRARRRQYRCVRRPGTGSERRPRLQPRASRPSRRVDRHRADRARVGAPARHVGGSRGAARRVTPQWRGLLLGELLFGLDLSSPQLGETLRPNKQRQGTPIHHELLGRLPVHRHANTPAPAEGDVIDTPAPADE